MVYGVVESLSAPFFFGADDSTGEVTIINDLKTNIKQQYDVCTKIPNLLFCYYKHKK